MEGQAMVGITTFVSFKESLIREEEKGRPCIACEMMVGGHSLESHSNFLIYQGSRSANHCWKPKPKSESTGSRNVGPSHAIVQDSTTTQDNQQCHNARFSDFVTSRKHLERLSQQTIQDPKAKSNYPRSPLHQ